MLRLKLFKRMTDELYCYLGPDTQCVVLAWPPALRHPTREIERMRNEVVNCADAYSNEWR